MPKNSSKKEVIREILIKSNQEDNMRFLVATPEAKEAQDKVIAEIERVLAQEEKD